MVDPGEIGQSISAMGANLMPSLMKWTGVTLVIVLILGIFYALFVFWQYKYHVINYVLGRMGDKLYIRDIIKTRARLFCEKGVDKLQFIFSKTALKPNFDYIYPRNNIVVFQVGKNHFLPGQINFSDNPGGYITPVDEDVNFWAHVQTQQAIRDYQEQNFMSKYGTFFFGFLTVLACLILAGTVIYFTYRYIGGELGQTTQAAKTLADSFKEGVTQRFSPG